MNDMLLNFKHVNFDRNFVGTDSKEAYAENLHRNDINWFKVYGDNPIEYDVNSNNYRCSNFSDIDWNNSVLMFGCSHVFGTGLHIQDTISAQLEKHLEYPVINLGVPASSMYFSFLNQLILKKNQVKPKAVINLWSSLERYSLFKGDINSPLPLGPWMVGTDWARNNESIIDFYSQWTNQYNNIQYYGNMLSDTVNIFWNDIPHVECTFFSNTAESLGIKLINQIDYARDLYHPGKDTNKMLAKFLKIKLSRLL
jgi:hypothetical protein